MTDHQPQVAATPTDSTPTNGTPVDNASPPPCEFVAVCRAGQVRDGYVRRFYATTEHGELELAISRLHGKAYATSNYCTHLDCLLSSGKLQDDGIRCSCHNSVFELEGGTPIQPPATEPIATYPVREEDGKVLVGLTERDVLEGGPRRRRLPK
ncbi:Rieske 2Fe-2S domain-containing protein [Rhodococcus sp. X156]|uniref:Rieske (2Fe-2S) protein n=1 Tax=Rhodococcus sp. X156 TaxID=2499145 RepID=UPI000FD79185|nr:Rieske 2Fe-2S domain-containing protein [Rhodococcus sp. X156]